MSVVAKRMDDLGHNSLKIILVTCCTVIRLELRLEKKEKGKEEYLYSAFLHQGTHKALRHGSHSITCNNTMPAFPSWRSPDVTSTATEAADIQLQLTTHLSTPKG